MTPTPTVMHHFRDEIPRPSDRIVILSVAMPSLREGMAESKSLPWAGRRDPCQARLFTPSSCPTGPSRSPTRRAQLSQPGPEHQDVTRNCLARPIQPPRQASQNQPLTHLRAWRRTLVPSL